MTNRVLYSQHQATSDDFELKYEQVADVCHLMMGLYSEKCIGCFHPCVTIMAYIYTKLGSRAHCICSAHNCILGFKYGWSTMGLLTLTTSQM